MINIKINIPDKKGSMNLWNIEEDMGAVFTIVADCDKGYISYILKDRVFIKDGILYSDDIRNPFNQLSDRHYSKAAFCEIWVED